MASGGRPEARAGTGGLSASVGPRVRGEGAVGGGVDAGGGSSIDEADGLRGNSAASVLPFEPLTPSTLGTWLRSFSWGHVRQFDRAHELALGRAWSAARRWLRLR